MAERIDGVTASFIKELVRRALLDGFEQGEEALDQRRLEQAADEMLRRADPVVRAMLGAPVRVHHEPTD